MARLKVKSAAATGQQLQYNNSGIRALTCSPYKFAGAVHRQILPVKR